MQRQGLLPVSKARICVAEVRYKCRLLRRFSEGGSDEVRHTLWRAASQKGPRHEIAGGQVASTTLKGPLSVDCCGFGEIQ
jgi:hypothetical protein